MNETLFIKLKIIVQKLQFKTYSLKRIKTFLNELEINISEF